MCAAAGVRGRSGGTRRRGDKERVKRNGESRREGEVRVKGWEESDLKRMAKREGKGRGREEDGKNGWGTEWKQGRREER